MAEVNEQEIARQARAIEVLERLGNNEDRNRGAQARVALDQVVSSAVQAGYRFSQGVADVLTRAGIAGAQAFDTAQNTLEQAPSALMGAFGPDGALSRGTQTISDTLGGFLNPASAQAPAINPELQAQIERINAADPLASTPLAGSANNPQAAESIPPPVIAPSLQQVPTPTPAAPAASGAPLPAAPPSNTQALLEQMTQQYLSLGQQANAADMAQIQNALALDELNRAQVSAGLVSAPRVASPEQLLGNANLASAGVPQNIASTVGAFQQLSPSAQVSSVTPAINASAAQSRSVNAQESRSAEQSARAIREAQELARLRRQAFINNVVVPRLSQPRD